MVLPDNPGDVDKLAEDLRRRIRSRREELKLSQKALATRLGISYQQLQKYERGTDRISASMLVKLGHHLNCRPSELIGEGQPVASQEVLSRLEEPETAELLNLYARLPTAQLRQDLIALLAQFAR